MRYLRHLLTTFCALCAIFAGGFCAAQDVIQGPANYRVRTLPQATETASPFTVNAPDAEISNSIVFLGPDSMSSADLQVVNGATSAIRSRATLAGFNLDAGKWSYQQIVCPVVPEHLLLLYSRNDGPDDTSVFSVILPRNGSGARVLPILHRSFTPYTPAPVNPLSIAMFNRVRENENTVKKPDWLMTGLCYAALTGSHVKLVSPEPDHAGSVTPAMTPLLQIDEGTSMVRFLDVEKVRAPREWNLTFDSKGKLVKVAVAAYPALQVKMIP